MAVARNPIRIAFLSFFEGYMRMPRKFNVPGIHIQLPAQVTSFFPSYLNHLVLTPEASEGVHKKKDLFAPVNCTDRDNTDIWS